MFAEVPIRGGLARSWQAQTGMGEKQKYTLKLKVVECIQYYTRTTCTALCAAKIQYDVETTSYITYLLMIKSNTAYQTLIKQKKNQHLSFMNIHFPTIMQSPHHGERTSRDVLLNETYSD